MTKALKKLIEENLSSLGIVELIDERHDKFGGYYLLYSLSLTAITPEFSESGTLDIEVSFNDYQELTYELGKYSIPFYVNSNDELKCLLEGIIDLPLPFSVSYEPITEITWDRYKVSIDGVETTRIIELVTMIKVLEDYLSQMEPLINQKVLKIMKNGGNNYSNASFNN